MPTLKAHLNDENSNDWNKVLPVVQRELNAAKNSTTGFAPYEALFGYMPNFEHDVLDIIAGEGDARDHTDVWNEMHENIKKAEITYKKRYDATKRHPSSYEPGDVVVVQRPTIATGEPTKLQPLYKGPFMVYKVLPSDTYVIGDLPTSNRSFRTTAHISQMRRYLNEEESSDEDVSDDNPAPENDCELSENDSELQENDSVQAESKRMRKPPQHLADYVV